MCQGLEVLRFVGRYQGLEECRYVGVGKVSTTTVSAGARHYSSPTAPCES